MTPASSSSNIFTQSGAPFNNGQLDKLIESEEKIKSGLARNHDDNLESAAAPIRAAPLASGGRANGLAVVIQVKSPSDAATSDGDSRQRRSVAVNAEPIGVASTRTSGQSSATTLFAADNAARQSAENKSAAAVGNRSLGGKSVSLSAFNISSAVTAASVAGLKLSGATDETRASEAAAGGAPNDEGSPHEHPLQDDDDQCQLQRVKLVEQLYGDSKRVHAAAIVIQRAFRKYQICKRFRTITEQLRHTCHAANISSSSNDTSASSFASSTSQQHPTSVPEKRLTTVKSSSSGISSNCSSQSNSSTKLSDITYAAGTTRAATWDSLSQAASRLAASAAAATGVARQANSGSKAGQQKQSTSITMNAIVTPQHQASGRLSRNHSKLNADSVAAAAINFQQLESIRKRQYRVGLNIFNKSPEKGISFLVAHAFIDSSAPYSKSSTSYYQPNQLHLIDAKHLNQQQHQLHTTSSCHLCLEEENLKRNVAHFLLHRKGLAKEKIGQYLGNLQEPFNQDVLKFYLQELDFNGLQIDIALRKFSSTFRLPGEAQKIERIVDRFAQRYVQCQQSGEPKPVAGRDSTAQPATSSESQQQSVSGNSDQNQSNYKNNLMLLTKDEIFILTFAIIMLNTDLHSPSLKPTSRMSANQFINNLRGVFKSQTINESDLIEIYERVKTNQITTTPDHVTHVMKVQQGLTATNFQRSNLPNLCVPHRRLVCFCRLFEVYDVNKKERVGQHQREIFLFNDMLLVTKLARRVRANTVQLYTYRQSIPLHGLYVQLFQSPHYNHGIKLCQRSNDETLIMFNARNELDQSRFVDDLSESIAEMNEMATIKVNNTIDTIHHKYQERLRRHKMLHNNVTTNENSLPLDATSQTFNDNPQASKNSAQIKANDCDNNNRRIKQNKKQQLVKIESDHSSKTTIGSVTPAESSRRIKSKFSSMLNLSSVAESRDDDCEANDPSANESPNRSPLGMRQNLSFNQQSDRVAVSDESHSSDQMSGSQRRCSSSSVHSLDSGLFLSRDVSPNQSS